MSAHATAITLATTMSTMRQRKRPDVGDPPGGVADDDVTVDEDAEACMFSPPCAGMIRIRFDGRSVDRFLSARLTGLPWL
ncbi:hypothetical protein GCM10009724_18750 [Microbacterium lacticum]|nr:hypothetical protein MLA01_19030 [Microbacterium lacticum]GGI67825.1 hypothetical protein GCM10009724_18750 [Microbacterium lacticum]